MWSTSTAGFPKNDQVETTAVKGPNGEGARVVKGPRGHNLKLIRDVMELMNMAKKKTKI